MNNQKTLNYPVAVIGAGPAGLYAAKRLAEAGAVVALINRDIKPGGLAEYGIFHNKYKMKNGLRKQFRRLLETPNIHYFGNVSIHNEDGGISLSDLKSLGFQAVMVTVGAQGTKWLGLPGEDLEGVYHAKDLVYHYNQLPPFSQKKYPFGERVIVIGVGNVMLDIANYAIRDLKIGEVIAVARRGPADVKFTKKEMSLVAQNLDQEAIKSEIARTGPVMEKVGQSPEEAEEFILSALKKASEPISETTFSFRFLASPKAIVGQNGKVSGLEVEHTTLEMREGGGTKAVKLGTTEVIPCDTIVFCIGDRVDQEFGLPLDQWQEFAKHPEPNFPVNEVSFEAFDPASGQAVDGVFLAGWSREASSGLVGVARKDGENGAAAIEQYLITQPSTESPEQVLAALESRLKALGKPVVSKPDLEKLHAVEVQKAEELNLEHFKYSTNEEMLQVMGLSEGTAQLA